MSEKKQEKTEKQDKKEEKKPDKRPVQEVQEYLIRIKGQDVPGSKNVYSALTRIKGISWAISNFICIKLGIPRNKKISELTKADIEQIESFLKTIPLPEYMKNRRSDPETGASAHLYTTDLDITREFDIKRLKKMKSYVGIRHSSKLPVRGQRTRSHFRVKAKASGMKRAKAPSPATPSQGGKK
jgi:small subunit ribosomal protein S13